MNNPQQPRESDAVLGGNISSPEDAVVLGGIEGVKLQLNNPDSKVRIAALEQALNYGEQGLDLVIVGLKHEYGDVQNAAYLLLKSRTEGKIQQVLIESDAHLRIGCTTDYTRLRDYLAQAKWEKADEETWRVMLVVSEREKEGYLRGQDIDNFPCEDLRTIDALWVKYSNGSFGFSVQKRIYQGLGGTRKYNERIWSKFGFAVGWGEGLGRTRERWWLYYNTISFDIKAPEGHLPWRKPSNFQVLSESGYLLFSRVGTCKL